MSCIFLTLNAHTCSKKSSEAGIQLPFNNYPLCIKNGNYSSCSDFSPISVPKEEHWPLDVSNSQDIPSISLLETYNEMQLVKEEMETVKNQISEFASQISSLTSQIATLNSTINTQNSNINELGEQSQGSTLQIQEIQLQIANILENCCSDIEPVEPTDP